MMRSAAEAIDRFFAARMFPRGRVPTAADVSGLERYKEEAWRPPEEFFALPRPLCARKPAFSDVDPVCLLRFRSPADSPWRENDTVVVHLRRCREKPQGPSVIILHGWRETGLLYSRWMQRGFLRAHMHAMVMELPYHYRRTPRGTANGDLMLSGDLARTVRAIRQAVLDVRFLVDWVRASSAGPVGLFGTSLGGLVAALAAVATGSLDFVILNTPSVDLPASMTEEGVWREFRGDVLRRWEAHADLVREVMRIVTPRCHPLRVPRERVLLIEALRDTLVPCGHTEALWQAWGQPPRMRCKHGHITNLVLNGPKVLRVACGFIRGLT